MARRSDLFVQQYDEWGETYMHGQLALPTQALDRALRAQLNFPLNKKKLLDAGCGYGHDVPYFVRRGATVYGIDPSKKMIALARKRNPAVINLSVQPLQRTTFPNNSFDVVVSKYALHNVINLQQAFQELHRMLKPKGMLIFAVNHPLFIFLAKKSNTYHSKEIVQFPILDGQCLLQQPAHTFAEYFNAFVCSRFDLLAFTECKEPVPRWFLAKLRKR